MSFKAKMMLGWLGMLAIVIGIGLVTVRQVAILGDAIDVILRENYRSVIACQDMKEALERIDSGLLFVLLDEPERGRSLLEANRGRVEAALEVESGNITLPGEKELVNNLRSHLAGMKEDLTGITDPALASAERRQLYLGQWLPRFEAMKVDADAILHMNQQNMHDANENARRLAQVAHSVQYTAILAGLMLTIFFGVKLQRWVLDPIMELTVSTREIVHGNLDRNLEVKARDEIGELTSAFNHMTASMREARRMASLRLARSEGVRAEMFGALPLAVAVISPDGTVEASTEQAAREFALKQEHRVVDNPNGWLRKVFEPDAAAAVATGDTLPYFQHFIGGDEHYVQPILHAIRSAEGEFGGVILLLQDVSQLREQQELKRSVVSTVSHQLKTPLTSMRMSLHLLLDDQIGPLSSQQVDLVQTARDDCERLSRTVDELLDINRIGTKRDQIQVSPQSPLALLERGLAQVRDAFDEAGVGLVVALPDDAPPVLADAPRLDHVFLNLLRNALRYTPSKGTVRIGFAVDGAMGIFRVADTGRGIAPEHLAHVFEPFYRADDAPHDGVGLGLSIVREIVAAHGGETGVESAPGHGATFWFTLRLADVPEIPA